MVPTIVYITQFRWACRISTAWHLQQLQEGSEGLGWGAEKEYITGGLRSQHAKSLAGVCHAAFSV